MLRCMRTTLTLDDDIAAHIAELRERRESTLKELVNEALRIGLRELERPSAPREPYQTPAESLGGSRLPELDDVTGALAYGARVGAGG